MRIGMEVNNLTTSGGYQKLVLRLSEQLQQMGHDVRIYTLAVDKQACYPDLIKHADIMVVPESKSELSETEQAKALAKIIDPDLDYLIIHDELGVMVVQHFNKPTNCTITWMLNNQLSDRFLNSKHIGREEFAGVTGVRTSLAAGKRFLKRFNQRGEQMRGVDKIDHFATYDSFNAKLVRQHLGRRPTLVYAGADLDEFSRLKSQAKTKHGGFNILSVGVVYPHRRYEDLIIAVGILIKQGEKVHLTIIGKQNFAPDYFQQLQDLVQQENVGKVVEFKNFVSDEEMKQAYLNADLFAFVNDGFTWGISVFEAVAAGIPVLITNNIGAADIIDGEQYGLLVPPRKPAAIATAIKSVMGDPAHTKQVADRARKHTMELVSWPAYAKRMLELVS